MSDSRREHDEDARTLDTIDASKVEAGPDGDKTKLIIPKAGGRVSLPAPGADRTEFAQEAFKFSAVFKYVFDKKTYGTDPPRRLEVREGEALSTGGGVKTRQPLVLLPINGNKEAIVCGWVDSAKKAAELRSYTQLCRSHESRYHRAFPLNADEFTALFEDVRLFMHRQQMEFGTSPADSEPAVPAVKPPPPPARPERSAGEQTMLALFVLFTVILAVLLTLVIKRVVLHH